MKEENTIYEQGHAFVASQYPGQTSFSENNMAFAFYKGFKEGHNEGFTDARETSPIADVIFLVKKLADKAKKIGLYFSADISLVYARFSATIYSMDDSGHLQDRVWEGNPAYTSDNLAKIVPILADAETFLNKYAEDSVENLTAEIAKLSERLKATKKKLASVKKETAK